MMANDGNEHERIKRLPILLKGDRLRAVHAATCKSLWVSCFLGAKCATKYEMSIRTRISWWIMDHWDHCGTIMDEFPTPFFLNSVALFGGNIFSVTKPVCHHPGLGRRVAPGWSRRWGGAFELAEHGWAWLSMARSNAIASGKQTNNYGQSPCLMGKSTINGNFK